MDDIFYMSANKVGIIDISESAKKVNVKSTFIPESSDVLEIEYCDDIIANWFCMRLDDFRELEDQRFLIDNKIESIFCISYHSSDFALIRPHIKTLLKEYGGWIGNDEDGFQPCFNLGNLDLFNNVST